MHRMSYCRDARTCTTESITIKTMPTTTLNATQMHLLQLFSQHKSEAYARQIEKVLSLYLQQQRDADGEPISEADYDRMLFCQYLDLWKQQTKFLSSVTQIKQNPSFQSIVDMGGNAVPFILEEIEKRPSHLVWALNAIFHKRIGEQTTVSEACKLWIRELKKS